VGYAAITDATAMPRRNAVAIEKCDDCHNQLSMHGNNRTDSIEVCVTCHAPNVTDVNRRAGQCEIDLGLDDTSVDMKYMIHAMHASGATDVPYEVCGFGNSSHVFDFVYPGKLNNCEGCHVAGGYYPVDPATVLGTTVDSGADPATPTDDVVVSPNTAVCSTCHASELAANHMIQNGGDFNATKAADSSLISSGAETCGLCHGEGRSADVAIVHGIDTFESN
jgi:OmcA/MtrC family decaheme c-type cytochrome